MSAYDFFDNSSNSNNSNNSNSAGAGHSAAAGAGSGSGTGQSVPFIDLSDDKRDNINLEYSQVESSDGKDAKEKEENAKLIPTAEEIKLFEEAIKAEKPELLKIKAMLDAKPLLAKKATFNPETLLTYVLKRAMPQPDKFELIKLLLDKSPRLLRKWNMDGDTPCIYAALNDQLAIFEYMIALDPVAGLLHKKVNGQNIVSLVTQSYSLHKKTLIEIVTKYCKPPLVNFIQERMELFKKLMLPLNEKTCPCCKSNRGCKINCARVAENLDEALNKAFNPFYVKKEVTAEPAGSGYGTLLYKIDAKGNYIINSNRSEDPALDRLTRSSEEGLSIVERLSLNRVTSGSGVSSKTMDSKEKSEMQTRVAIEIDGGKDPNSVNSLSQYVGECIPPAHIMREIRRLPRRLDGTTQGYIIFMKKDMKSEGHVCNFFCDSVERGNTVYFLDAQRNPNDPYFISREPSVSHWDAFGIVLTVSKLQLRPKEFEPIFSNSEHTASLPVSAFTIAAQKPRVPAKAAAPRLPARSAMQPQPPMQRPMMQPMHLPAPNGFPGFPSNSNSNASAANPFQPTVAPSYYNPSNHSNGAQNIPAPAPLMPVPGIKVLPNNGVAPMEDEAQEEAATPQPDGNETSATESLRQSLEQQIKANELEIEYMRTQIIAVKKAYLDRQMARQQYQSALEQELGELEQQLIDLKNGSPKKASAGKPILEMQKGAKGKKGKGKGKKTSRGSDEDAIEMSAAPNAANNGQPAEVKLTAELIIKLRADLQTVIEKNDQFRERLKYIGHSGGQQVRIIDREIVKLQTKIEKAREALVIQMQQSKQAPAQAPKDAAPGAANGVHEPAKVVLQPAAPLPGSVPMNPASAYAYAPIPQPAPIVPASANGISMLADLAFLPGSAALIPASANAQQLSLPVGPASANGHSLPAYAAPAAPASANAAAASQDVAPMEVDSKPQADRDPKPQEKPAQSGTKRKASVLEEGTASPNAANSAAPAAPLNLNAPRSASPTFLPIFHQAKKARVMQTSDAALKKDQVHTNGAGSPKA